jgi:hypothetical protein
MTDDEARQKLLELDHRYRLILSSTPIDDLVCDPATQERMAEARRKFFQTERAIGQLRAAHPKLFRQLTAQFRQAHPIAKATTNNLIDFAYRKHLRLTGEPIE